MNNEYKHHCIRTFSFLVISFLYFTVFENDFGGTADYSHAFDITNIEVNAQPELTQEFQPYKGSSSLKQRKSYGSFYLENIYKFSKKLFLSANNISNIYLNIQNKHSSPLHHIVTILQKNNTWHRSSDDDAPLYDFC